MRSGTNDAWVWQNVVHRNEYFVPESLSSEDAVVDVGLHIGSFSYLVLTRGAGRVFGFEVDRENCSLARFNLKHFGKRVFVVQGAVCRSDWNPKQLFFSGYPFLRNGILNTGGGNVGSQQGGRVVPAIPFDSIVDSIVQQGYTRIRLLKLDCEGSEYPILMTSKRLHLIDEVVGEYHELGHGADDLEIPTSPIMEEKKPLGAEILRECLAKNGFAVRLGNRVGRIGKFLAWNKNSLTSAFFDTFASRTARPC